MKLKFEVGQWVWAFCPQSKYDSSIMCVYAQIDSITVGHRTINYKINEYDDLGTWTRVPEEGLFGSDADLFEEIKVRKKYLQELKQKKDQTEKETF